MRLGFILLTTLLLAGCKNPIINNVSQDDHGRYITLVCPPYGEHVFYIDDGDALGEEWDDDKTVCLNWIHENWQTIWPNVHEKLNEMAENYAYGEKKLEPHIQNPKNILSLSPIDKELWGMSLEIETGRGGAFCLDMKRDQVLEYQPVY